MIAPRVRRIESRDKILYLTFDDGPEPRSTPAVLEILSQKSVPATFFLIAQKARSFPDLSRRLIAEGHAIGNHSLDHGYRNFFSSRARLVQWIVDAEEIFRGMKVEPVGFRPPAGVVTPNLRRALAELDLPLVLWSTRFFDTRFMWTREKAAGVLGRLEAGGIVLLHDRQSPRRLATFLDTLAYFVDSARAQGFEFRRLDRSLCLSPRIELTSVDG